MFSTSYLTVVLMFCPVFTRAVNGLLTKFSYIIDSTETNKLRFGRKIFSINQHLIVFKLLTGTPLTNLKVCKKKINQIILLMVIFY